MNITDLTATKFGISHSKGMGLLGGNIFGVSSIQQAVFIGSNPNCAIIFLDSYCPPKTPVLHITDSLFSLGTGSNVFPYYKLAAGLNVIAIQTMYHTAEFAGTALYGGSVDFCKFSVNYQMLSDSYGDGTSQTSIFDSLFHFHQSTQQLSLISSNPTRVCLCTNMSIHDCSITKYTVTAYPGQTFTIPAVAVGQRFGTLPSTVHSNFVYLADMPTDENRLPALQYTQLVNGNCTDLMYTILSSSNRAEDMELTVENRTFHTTRL